MKITFLLLLISLLCVTNYSQRKMTDREFEGLRGKVKSVYVEDTDLEIVKGKPVFSAREMQFDELYDEAGNMTQSSMYYMGDRSIFSFIDSEKTSKSTNFKPSKASMATISGVATENTKPRDPRYNIKYRYEYDANGRIIKEIKYRNDGTLFSKTNYKYDDKEKLIEEVWFYDDKVSKNLYYTYDAKGILTEKKYVPTGTNGETDIIIHRFKDYKFDAQGNWIQRTQTTIYTSDGQKKENQTIYYRKIEYYK